MLLFDPQTSGGLLVAVPSEREVEFVASLPTRRVHCLARGRGRRGRRARSHLTRRRDVSPGSPAFRRAADRVLDACVGHKPRISRYELLTPASRGIAKGSRVAVRSTVPAALLVAPERTKRKMNVKRTLYGSLNLCPSAQPLPVSPRTTWTGCKDHPLFTRFPSMYLCRLRQQPVRHARVSRRPAECGTRRPSKRSRSRARCSGSATR